MGLSAPSKLFPPHFKPTQECNDLSERVRPQLQQRSAGCVCFIKSPLPRASHSSSRVHKANPGWTDLQAGMFWACSVHYQIPSSPSLGHRAAGAGAWIHGCVWDCVAGTVCFSRPFHVSQRGSLQRRTFLH